MSSIDKTYYDKLMQVVSCAINNVPLSKDLQTLQCNEDFRTAAKEHMLESCSEYAFILSCEDEETKKEIHSFWDNANARMLRVNLSYEAERKKIFNWLTNQKIWHMPLKGCVIAQLYPNLGLRQMFDNDFLYDADNGNDVALRDYMIEKGYKCESFNIGADDHYTKPPFLYFEPHRKLFIGAGAKGEEHYYKDVRSRLIPCENNEYELAFTNEDFYIYLLTHSVKHLRGNSAGLRTLVDIYLYIQNYNSQLNWKYIEQELNALCVAGESAMLKACALKLLQKPTNVADAKLTKEEEALFWRVAYAGVDGNIERIIAGKLKDINEGDKKAVAKAKRSYIMSRIFPSIEKTSEWYPILRKHRWLYPAIWVVRCFKLAFNRRDFMAKEFKELNKATAEKSENQ